MQQVRSIAIDGTDAQGITEGYGLTISPNERWLTYLAPLNNAPAPSLYLLAMDSKAPIALGVNLPPPIFSPDSRRMVWTVEWQQNGHFMNAVMLATITAQGVEQHQLLQQANYQCQLHVGCFSPDSRRLVCHDHGLAMYDLDSGLRTAVLEDADVGLPSFTPNGTHLVFVCQGHLCACQPDGSDLRVLTPDIQIDNDSRWSYTYAPGDRIIFAAMPE